MASRRYCKNVRHSNAIGRVSQRANLHRRQTNQQAKLQRLFAAPATVADAEQTLTVNTTAAAEMRRSWQGMMRGRPSHSGSGYAARSEPKTPLLSAAVVMPLVIGQIGGRRQAYPPHCGWRTAWRSAGRRSRSAAGLPEPDVRCCGGSYRKPFFINTWQAPARHNLMPAECKN